MYIGKDKGIYISWRRNTQLEDRTKIVGGGIPNRRIKIRVLA